MWVWTGPCSSSCVNNSFLWLFCYCHLVIRQDPEAGWQDCKNVFSMSFPRLFTRQVFCSFLSAPICGKSCKHLFNTEVIVESSISRTWMPHAIFLSDRNDLLWECWYSLSNLTNQRVYQELVYLNGLFKEMIAGSAAPPLPSFLLFYVRVQAFNSPDRTISKPGIG